MLASMLYIPNTNQQWHFKSIFNIGLNPTSLYIHERTCIQRWVQHWHQKSSILVQFSTETGIHCKICVRNHHTSKANLCIYIIMLTDATFFVTEHIHCSNSSVLHHWLLSALHNISNFHLLHKCASFNSFNYYMLSTELMLFQTRNVHCSLYSSCSFQLYMSTALHRLCSFWL